jgi:hypothetical protein
MKKILFALIISVSAHAAPVNCPDLTGKYRPINIATNDQDFTISQSKDQNVTRYKFTYAVNSSSPKTVEYVTDSVDRHSENSNTYVSAVCGTDNSEGLATLKLAEKSFSNLDTKGRATLMVMSTITAQGNRLTIDSTTAYIDNAAVGAPSLSNSLNKADRIH